MIGLVKDYCVEISISKIASQEYVKIIKSFEIKFILTFIVLEIIGTRFLLKAIRKCGKFIFIEHSTA